MKQSEILVGLGRLFTLLSLFPTWFFSIIGIALFLVGVNEISKATGESRIFNYFLIVVILNVILVFFYLQIIITVGF